MKAGTFNINDYLDRLNEEFADKTEGLIIPPENKKSFDWLKGEYKKAQTEVKVEFKMGASKFEPGYHLQTDLDSVKDFKPGMYGQVKTEDTKGVKKLKGVVKVKGVKESGEDLEEGNAFSGALEKAKTEGKKEFKVGDKTYPVK